MKVLVLTGTGDGRALAATVRAAGHEVVESVAGRTAEARGRDGAGDSDGTRVGGFGGVDGLVAWLARHDVDAVIDATHPFAARMSANAAQACAIAGVPLARWERPSWRERPDATTWRWVSDHAAAADAAGQVGGGGGGGSGDGGSGRVLLTVGRQDLDAYRALPDVVARVAEVPAGWVPPAGWELLVARGPYRLAGELALLRDRAIGVLVSKDAGSDATTAKLDAAAQLGVPVVMIARPPAPVGVPGFADTNAVLAWLVRGTLVE